MEEKLREEKEWFGRTLGRRVRIVVRRRDKGGRQLVGFAAGV